MALWVWSLLPLGSNVGLVAGPGAGCTYEVPQGARGSRLLGKELRRQGYNSRFKSMSIVTEEGTTFVWETTQIFTRALGAVPLLWLQSVRLPKSSVSVSPPPSVSMLPYCHARRAAWLPPAVFLWRNIGAPLLTVLPAMTYSLKEKADEGRLQVRY